MCEHTITYTSKEIQNLWIYFHQILVQFEFFF